MAGPTKAVCQHVQSMGYDAQSLVPSHACAQSELFGGICRSWCSHKAGEPNVKAQEQVYTQVQLF